MIEIKSKIGWESEVALSCVCVFSSSIWISGECDCWGSEFLHDPAHMVSSPSGTEEWSHTWI